MNKKIFRSASNRSIGIHNLFTRTSIFEPVADHSLNKSRSYKFNDSLYEVHINGKYLNLTTDFPLFCLLIRHWRNQQIAGESPSNPMYLALDLVKELIPIAGNGTREVEYSKVKASLSRLKSVEISYKYSTKYKKLGPLSGKLLESNSKLDFKNKEIKFTMSKFMIDLYLPNTNISYLNLEEMCSLSKEGNKALYRYLSTHGTVYMDFKFERLSKVLGLKYRKMSEARCREYIVKYLKELKALGVIRGYQWRKEIGVYRILQCRYFSEKEARTALEQKN